MATVESGIQEVTNEAAEEMQQLAQTTGLVEKTNEVLRVSVGELLNADRIAAAPSSTRAARSSVRDSAGRAGRCGRRR